MNLYGYSLADPIDFYDLNGLWTNPTNGGIRNNAHELRHYGAFRGGGKRTHARVDYAGQFGGLVCAPMSGTLAVIGPDTIRITGRVDGTTFSCRLKHVGPTAGVTGLTADQRGSK